MFSTNAAGLVNGKIKSLHSEVKATASNIVTVQETHSVRKGRVKMPEGFVIFEAIRKAKHGGTMCAVHEDLKPRLIEEYNDPFELIVVEIEGQNKSIRIITGCGPQENWQEDKRRPFFIALEAEIVKAEITGKSVIIEMDANSKLGPSYIPNDPHDISPNGNILAGIIERHALIVANGSDKCRGLITRQRNMKSRCERSCIDIVILSSDLRAEFKSLEIDESRKHVLTRISNTKKGAVIKESDHNVLLTEVNCEVNTHKKVDKVELYNLKNPICQKKFQKYTSGTKMLSSIFDSDEDINILTQRFIKKLDGCIKKNFNKIRISNSKKSEDEKLYDEMRELKGKNDAKSKEALENVIKAIADSAEKKYIKVVDELKKMKPEGGRIDAQKFWQMKKKIFPKHNDPPSAMLNKEGNIITSREAIEERAIHVYTERLEANKIKEHLEEYEKTANKLCETRLKLTKLNETEPWTLDDLDKATADLDNGKARDALNHANELFKKNVAGTDLKLAVLKLMNLIKNRQQYPECLEPCNITSLYKQKGSHKDFNNYRGVFRVTVFRSILDRLIYNDCYHIIDEHLTDGNVGARKHRNIRDNIFVLGAVMNSVINGTEDPIQIQVQDVNKCFDKLWLEETTNSLYEAGLRNHMLNLLYLENKRAKVAIKIDNKLTKRFPVNNVELQGSVWGSLKCTSSMDRLNKIILPQDNLTYPYKGDPSIKIGVLGMVDDNLAIAKCGTSSLQKNAVINSFIEMQRLTLSQDKSVVLHVGKKCKNQCPILKVHQSDMKLSQTVRYLGDIISSSGSLRPCIEDRRSKGWGKVSELKGIISELPEIRRIEIGLKL